MHGFITKGNLNQHRRDVNYATIEDYCDQANYNIWIPATDFVNYESSFTLLSTANSSPVRVFEEGKSNTVVAAIRKPKTWLNGICFFRVYYTTQTVAPAQNIALGLGLWGVAEGETIIFPGIGLFLITTTPAVAVATSVEIDRSFESNQLTAAVNEQRKMYPHTAFITVFIQRRGTDAGNDTYTDEFHLIGAEVFYQETEHQFSLKERAYTRSVGAVSV